MMPLIYIMMSLIDIRLYTESALQDF